MEKVERDPDTKRRIKKTVEEYEYDEAMEPSYMESMYRQFNKTLEEGFFNMILVDSVNHRVGNIVEYDTYLATLCDSCVYM